MYVEDLSKEATDIITSNLPGAGKWKVDGKVKAAHRDTITFSPSISANAAKYPSSSSSHRSSNSSSANNNSNNTTSDTAATAGEKEEASSLIMSPTGGTAAANSSSSSSASSQQMYSVAIFALTAEMKSSFIEGLALKGVFSDQLRLKKVSASYDCKSKWNLQHLDVTLSNPAEVVNSLFSISSSSSSFVSQWASTSAAAIVNNLSLTHTSSRGGGSSLTHSETLTAKQLTLKACAGLPFSLGRFEQTHIGATLKLPMRGPLMKKSSSTSSSSSSASPKIDLDFRFQKGHPVSPQRWIHTVSLADNGATLRWLQYGSFVASATPPFSSSGPLSSLFHTLSNRRFVFGTEIVYDCQRAKRMNFSFRDSSALPLSTLFGEKSPFSFTAAAETSCFFVKGNTIKAKIDAKQRIQLSYVYKQSKSTAVFSVHDDGRVGMSISLGGE